MMESITNHKIAFLIGKYREIYSLPIEVIEKDTYLDTYLKFNDNKKTTVFQGMDGQKITHYFLSEEDHWLFSEFHSFLLGGDFMWNEEVIQYFAFMGYHNTMNYPMDFWKVKLQDNWIRNNFYRLELWNPESKKGELLIKRGPYVGLVEIPLRTQLITPRRTSLKDLDVFKEVINFEGSQEGSIVLAGGALVTLLYDERTPPDFDLFITSKDPEVGKAHIKHIIENYDLIYRNYNKNDCLVSSEIIYPLDLIVRTENAITIGKRKPKYQVILRLYTCPSEVVHGFDLDSCGILYDGKKIWATKRTSYSFKHKINYFDFDRMSPTYGHRLAKYASKGFEVWLPNFNPEKALWDDLHNISLVAESCKEYSDYSKSFATYAPYYHLDCDDTKGLREIEDVKKILKRGNPLDLILFATYFRYLPNLHSSDYAEIKEKKLQSFSRGKVHITGSVSEGEFIDIEEDLWEIVGPGYVIFTTQNTPFEAIFNLHPESCQLSGLTPDLRWKTQNPMEQLSGTFNPTTLNDLKIWFDEAYLYSETSESKLYPPIHDCGEERFSSVLQLPLSLSYPKMYDLPPIPVLPNPIAHRYERDPKIGLQAISGKRH